MKAGTDSSTVLRRWLGTAILAVSGALPVAAYGVGVAMVTDLQGRASMAGDGRTRDVTILAELEAGAHVQLAAGATLVALYLDAGDEYVFKGPAAIVFKATQPEVASGARPEKRSVSLGKGGRDIRIKPVGMAQGAMVMRGLPLSARIRLLSLHQTRTLETRPEFRWQELQPGLKYQIEITDDTGRTVHESLVDSVAFKLPVSVRLKEGASYTWRVSTQLPDGEKFSSAADFAVARVDLRMQAEALRPAASAPLSSRIAYAAWLNQVELKDEARKVWQIASAERPDDARLKALAAE